MSSGIITHAPAAAMAEISNPVDSVDFGMFAHRGHIEALTQPRSLQPGSSPVLGNVAHDGHDGCIDSWLGSSMRGNASFGTVHKLAHKLPGAGSNLSSKGFSATAGTAACTDSHRQHICGFVYKSPERNSLKGAMQAGNGLSLHLSCAHPWSPDPRGEHVFEEGDSSRRMEIAPRVGSDDLEPLTLKESGGGSVRQEREHALPAVLHSPLT